MSSTEEIGELIRYRLDEVRETLNDARLLVDHDRLRAANNRIYYGFFYALLALGLKYDFTGSKHPELIAWFNNNFVRKGLIDTRYGKILNRAFNRRTKGDYDSFVEFNKNTTLEMLDELKEFMGIIGQFL